MTDMENSRMQELMTQAYERWQANRDWSIEKFWDQLDADERMAVFTGNFNYQVENGGFIQWYDNRYAQPQVVDYLLRLCDDINTDASKKVKELIKSFKNALKSCQVDRRGDLEIEDWDALCDTCNGLDSPYYEINQQFLEDMEKYIEEKHPAKGAQDAKADA